ncbi:ribonuclease Z [Natronococcus amylolyticus DSM 10524]|uniref:Ribonuclease Z n=1 Tax=Natronococcus amylolyticus DSM 10524 TaxID=1227497 RepID=L9XC39_9EURY|nr:ribonuclease Z [Natronococcus amylolyticus]ELY59202.1 ribonuclease Z [Natronococcus amylolyticus DSM 10524]
MPLRVTFLGTGGAVPTTERNPSGIFVAREGEGLLFDAAEGTQRQMMRFGTGFSIAHIFVTHLHGDHVLGIPGLIQTMDFNDREDALAIHGPRGTRRELESLVHALGNRPSFPVRISEVGDGDVAYRADEFEVRAFATDHDTRSVGYALVEDDRKGRFDRERAEELGVPVGPKFSRLHEGESVELEDGTVVDPEQVVGDPRPGRAIVYTGDTRPTAATIEAADDPDLLIHDATFADDRADRAADTAHSTARQAAEIANRAGAKRLALMHLSSRYAGDVSAHLEEAREVFSGEVFVPDDGETLELEYPDV